MSYPCDLCNEKFTTLSASKSHRNSTRCQATQAYNEMVAEGRKKLPNLLGSFLYDKLDQPLVVLAHSGFKKEHKKSAKTVQEYWVPTEYFAVITALSNLTSVKKLTLQRLQTILTMSENERDNFLGVLFAQHTHTDK